MSEWCVHPGPRADWAVFAGGERGQSMGVWLGCMCTLVGNTPSLQDEPRVKSKRAGSERALLCPSSPVRLHEELDSALWAPLPALRPLLPAPSLTAPSPSS